MRKYFGVERRENKTLYFKRTGVPMPWEGGREGGKERGTWLCKLAKMKNILLI